MSDQEKASPPTGEAARLAALGQIAGELIHDLANVVAVVHGRASLALGDSRAGRPPTAELERLVESSEDLSVMLRDVLEILRGSQVSPEVRFDPIRVVERAIRRFLDSAPPLEIRLMSSVPSGTLVLGRASFLSRAVLNLLNNAARFARSEIRITLSVSEAEEAQIELVVEDDGPGISSSLLSGAFRPLVQGERGGMAGLGLSSVSWAVQQLGGDIAYRTDSALGGARFDVALPATFPPRATPPPRLDLLVGKRLVLLEDDPAVQRALVRLLRRLGADVTAFDPRGESEDDIMSALLRAMPDVILLDLRLGAREGDEIWRALETQVPALARRVIFVSALAPGDPQWDAARATGQPVLPKPLDTGDLAGAVAHVLKTLSD